MCVGSYASRAENDVESMVDEFAESVNFVHLRNVRKTERSFVETDHLDGDVDMFTVMSRLLKEQDRRRNIGVRQQGLICTLEALSFLINYTF